MASTKTKRKKTNNKKKLSGVRGQAERSQEKQTDLRGITGDYYFLCRYFRIGLPIFAE